MGDGRLADVWPKHDPDAFPVEVLAGFRRRDPEAFREIYRRCAPLVRRWVAAFFARPFDQEEAAQEVWLMAHRAADTYQPERGDLAAWLRAVAGNRCKELLRARGRRVPEGEQGAEDLASATPSPESAARRSRLRNAVERFASSLDPQAAQVLRLGLGEGLPLEEVARRIGVNLRRSKYVKKKVLLRAAEDAGLREALDEILGEEL
jgi:RNA polymerase sigma-70 factor, ECF subfamily